MATAAELLGNTAATNGGRKGEKGGSIWLTMGDADEHDGVNPRRPKCRWSADDGNDQGTDESAGWLAEAGARGEGIGEVVLCSEASHGEWTSWWGEGRS
jgi:hypothetical protein